MKNVISIKKFKKEKIKKYIIYVLFIIIIFYIIYAIYLLIKSPTDTFTVESGTLTREETATGYIIREEKVLKGENYKNGITPIISEKNRAAKNQTVFRYMAKDEENLKSKIQEVDAKIQEALSKQSWLPSSDIKNLEKQIDEKTKLLNTETDLQKIRESKKEISSIILKKAKIIGELSNSGSYIKSLTTEREKYENELNSGSEYIKAPVAGLVSYRVDGLENTLTPECIENLTEKQLDGLGIKAGKIVPVSSESAKIINNFNVYIATILNSDIAKESNVGDEVKITISTGKQLNAKIQKKEEQESGKTLIVFKLNILTDEMIQYRKVSFNITWWSKSGLKIPNDAIVSGENDVKYVVKEKAGSYSNIYIKVLKQNDKYSIVENYSTEELNKIGINVNSYSKLSQYDMILMYPNKRF